MEMNRLPSRWKIAVVISTVIGLMGCNPQADTQQATLLPTKQVSEESTSVQGEVITQTVYPADMETCKSEKTELAGLRIQDFWWKSNSKEIIFLTEIGERGVYDIINNTYTLSDIELPAEKNIPEDIIRLLPETFDGYGVHLAPSGKKAIYVKEIANGVEVPTPQDMGESGYSEITSEVYWLENDLDNPVFIEQFEGQTNVLWSDSEEKVLLFSMAPTGPFGSITLWVFDITNLSLTKLLVPTDKNVYPISFTPDGEGVLYQIGNEVRLIHIQDFNHETLSIPPFKYFWWISSDQLIVLLPVDETLIEQRIFLYNISNDSSQILSDVSISPLLFNFYAAKISPDKSTIALIDNLNNHLNTLLLCQN